MGFLLGAFGKLMAGRRVRDLQARMMRVQSKARRTTRQIEKMSKMLETQKKMEINSLNVQQQYAQFMGPSMAYNLALRQVDGQRQAAINSGQADPFEGQQLNPNLGNVLMGGMDQNTLINNMGSQYSKLDQAVMSAYSGQKMSIDSSNSMLISQIKNQIEEKYENLNDIMLEPLKMEEDSLQTEKDSLESQIQIAQADYEACKKMEQADAKNLAPNYTGQG